MSDADLPLLDSAGALGRIRGKTGLYRRLLEQAQVHRGAMQPLRQALARGEPDAAEAIAHRLAGMSGALGASRLGAAARELEQQLHGGMPDEDAILRLEKTMAQTFEAMDAYLVQADAETNNNGTS